MFNIIEQNSFFLLLIHRLFSYSFIALEKNINSRILRSPRGQIFPVVPLEFLPFLIGLSTTEKLEHTVSSYIGEND